MAEPLFTAVPSSGTTDGPGTGRSVFLDVLNTVANWDLTKRFGLPSQIDGARAQPVSLPAEQNAARTPPAPPGAVSAFGVSGGQLALGAAGLAVVAGLVIWASK